ncbi:MAG: hypothetical protein R2828_26105 [Saprospiraceae bacterium]
MEEHFKLSDSEFENEFSNCTLNPEFFSHEAHIRLAWIHIDKYGIEQATENIQTQLKKYVDTIGAADKYNVTLTVAAIKAVYHYMLRSNSKNFSDFSAEFPQLKVKFKELMYRHYGFDIYNSIEAKLQFMEPALIPFD